MTSHAGWQRPEMPRVKTESALHTHRPKLIAVTFDQWELSKLQSQQWAHLTTCPLWDLLDILETDCYDLMQSHAEACAETH